MSTKRNDWLPSKREDQLGTAKIWDQIFAANQDKWNFVPDEMKTRLSSAVNAADMEISIPPGERNPVSNQRLKTAFAELVAVMRDIKKRYFYNPPLTDADLVSLGLTPKDTIPTSILPPDMPAIADIMFPASEIVELCKIRAVGANADSRAPYGVRIYYGVLGSPDEADRFRMTQRPKAGIDLPLSVFTRRKSHRFNFAGRSGNEVFFCLRYENSKGEAGPWGKLISGFIP